MKDKSILEVVLTPLAIALVGTLGTYLITNQQIESSKRASETQMQSTEKMTKSDQQIKIIEIFSDKITSKSIREREIAVRILSALDPDLSKKLTSAIAENVEEDSTIRKIADRVQRGTTFIVLGSHRNLREATSQSDSLSKIAMPYTPQIYDNKKGYYAVCFDGLLTSYDAEIALNYAQENLKIKDAYKRVSNIWEKISD